jgi:Cof subfamily protein (haloacid dehalogenase superfamily)
LTDPHYKLLVIDIDGTLINRYGDISPANREALTLARDSGMQVAISTGRSLNSSREIIKQLSLESYHIFFDGALVSRPDPAEEIYAQPISPAVVRQMVAFAHAHNIDLELHSTSHYFAERETWSTEAHRRFFGAQPTIGDFNRLWEQERIVKGALVVTSPQEEAGLKSFGDNFADRLHLSQVKIPTYPDVTFVNILAPDISKGRALKILASHLGVPLAEVAAVGDGQNDISLLATAGLAIAMGNAHSELKKIAHHITLDVAEDGLAAAIKRFLI